MSTADAKDADKTDKDDTSDACALVEEKEEMKELLPDSNRPILQDTAETQNTAEITQPAEYKYKEGKKDLSSCLYSALPETREMQFAREAKYRQAGRQVLSSPSYFLLSETPETLHAKKVSQLLSKNKYREESRTEMQNCLYSLLSETTESQFAKSVSDLVSETKYKQKAKERVSSFISSNLPQTHEMQLTNEMTNAEPLQKMDETDSESDLSNCLYSQMAETIQTRFAKELAPTLSEYQYKQEGKKELANCLYALLPKTRETQHAKELSQLYSKKHYKEGGKKDAEACLYAQMPQTIETVFAKEVTNHQSNKLYKEKYNAEKGKSLYASMKTLPAMEHAMEVNKEQSNVNYRKGIQQVHKFHEVADRPDILRAIQATKLASNVAYKNKVDTFKEQALLQRPDIDHAMQAAKVASKVHYKQKFEGDQRAHKPVYNPSDCLSFKHAKAATALISQVQYRKKYEEAKGQYHFSLNTAEHLHHKENSVLQSQVRYRQDYEKNKSKVKMEFGDTQFYRVSKEAQKLQSKKEYCKDYENCIKGKVQMDVESTPGYLSACSANRLLSEKEYCKDLKTEIIGKRVDIGTDAVEIQRAMKTSEITSQKKYKDNAETLKCSYAVMPDTPEMERAKINQRNISSVRYSWDVKHMKRLTLAVTETPEIILAKENTKKISNVKYRDEVGSGISVKDTLEMERVRRNQMNISSVKYREDFERTRGRSCTHALKNTGTGRQVWRTDPGSIFDFDPVEDNIQSRSLRRMSERPGHVSRHSVLSCAESVCSSSVSEEWGDESTSSNSSMSTLRNTPSTASVISDPVQQISQSHHLQPHHQQGYTAVQTVQSTPHLDIMRVYRALYDYTAQDHDEVSFQDGDVIISLQPVDEGWMYGTVQRTGQAGMLPANYVECLS